MISSQSFYKRQDISRELGAFGRLWVRKHRNEVRGNKLPTLRELLEGLFSWFIVQQEAKTKGWPRQRRIKMVRDARIIFIRLFDSLNIADWNLRLTNSGSSELSLGSPYSKVSCLLMQLYSMELGSPPLYAEVNRVAREMDRTRLSDLGPFIFALNVFLS